MDNRDTRHLICFNLVGGTLALRYSYPEVGWVLRNCKSPVVSAFYLFQEQIADALLNRALSPRYQHWNESLREWPHAREPIMF
jgi:hypothetical protein